MIWIGTSGYQYPEWKGKFYPEKFSPKKMLAFYSERFNSTESNYTFRRMPTEAILTNWAGQTPKQFRFSLKAPQEITHFRKLRDCESVVGHFTKVSQALGAKLGATLFQLSPSMHCDVALLREFLDVLPSGSKAAFEFRHESWFNDDVFAALRARDCALCIADSEKLHTPVVLTAKHAYFRLRDEGYGAADIQRWATEIQKSSASADDTYVYFKHEEKGLGPEFACQLVKHLDGAAAQQSANPDGGLHVEASTNTCEIQNHNGTDSLVRCSVALNHFVCFRGEGFEARRGQRGVFPRTSPSNF